MTETTKKCPVCGNTNLILLSSQDSKVCTDHDKHVKISWKLDDGQKSVWS